MRPYFVLLTVLMMIGCGQKPAAPTSAAASAPGETPSVFEVPESFTGWAVVRYSDSSCPPLSKIDEKWHVRFAADGRLCTSSDVTSDWRRDEYYVVGKKRRRVKLVGASSPGEVRNHATGRCSMNNHPTVFYQQFFVGSADQFRTAANPVIEGCDDVGFGSNTDSAKR